MSGAITLEISGPARRRRRRRFRWLLTGAVLVAALVWAMPLGRLLSVPLEERFQSPGTSGLAGLDGMIVLAGDYARFQAAMPLAASYPHLRLVLCTGPATERVHALARKYAISEARLTFELTSTNTYENATFTRRLLTGGQGPVPGRWLLVTSGTHMPRAVGAFRHARFDVVPYPILANEYPHDQHNVWLALWEWAGLVVYRVRGRTDAFWPAPR